MEPDADQIIYALLEEMKRLNLENATLRAMMLGQNHNANTDDEVES